MGPVPQPDEERDHPSQNENEIEDAEHPDVIINVDISDSDDGDDDDDDDVEGYGGYIGYQALAQDGGPTGHDSDWEEETEEPMQDNDPADVSDSNQEAVTAEGCHIPEGLVHQVRHPDYPNTSNLPGYMQVPDLPRPERKDMLWNQERQTENSLERDHADKILSVMSNIQLPTSNIPDWARSLSDDQWQVQVVNKLKHRTSPKNNSEVNKGSESNNVTDVQEVNQDQTDSKPDNKL